MEKSPFVISAETSDGRTLLYSTATGAFVSLDAFAMESYDGGQGLFAAELAEAGLLVEDAAAQVAEVHGRFKQQREDSTVLRICIAPTYACNCRCPYCYEADKMSSWSSMSDQVEQAIYDFVAQRYEADGFTLLDNQWYGGDPQLCLDLVERMSARLIAFCQERGIQYISSMLSNCTRIGEEEAQLIAKAQVQTMLVTVDGPEREHNKRRPTVEGSNSYQKVKAAIGYLMAAGVQCNVICNSDKVNLPLVPELQEDLAELGVSVVPVKLCNYSHQYGAGCFSKPDFDLFTHEEFHQACFRMMKSQGQLDYSTLAGMLEPSSRFCFGQRNSYFIIDNVGDVYKCDGRMGDKNYVLFNLLDDSAPMLDAVSFDPCADDECGQCHLLPLCWGNCRWERERCGMPCHPMNTVGDQYLREFAACFPPAEEPFVRLR